MAANRTYTFPAEYGAIGQPLVSLDGGGGLSWGAAGVTQAAVNASIDLTNATRRADIVCSTNIALTGGPTCDGQTVQGANVVLVRGQSDNQTNGIYLSDDFGAWTLLSGGNVTRTLVSSGQAGAGDSYQDTLWFGYGDGSSVNTWGLVMKMAASGPSFPGTNTNNNAAAGYVGEYLSVSRVRSSATSLTTNTTLDVTAAGLALTKGDWDLDGMVGFTLGATTSASVFQAAISTTTATLPGADTMGVQDSAGQIRSQYALVAAVIANDVVFLPVHSRVSIASDTTYYLVAQSTFTLSTNAAYGSLTARRIR
jgi:hypothetical protein